MNKTKKQNLNGIVFYHGNFSMRDKTTGEYSFMMDGNFNVMLNKIYDQLEFIQEVYVTVPKNRVVEHNDIFNDLNEVVFEGKIKLVEIDYGINAGDNRTKFVDNTNDMFFRKLFKSLSINRSGEIDTFVTEFPLTINNFPVLLLPYNVHYVFPMTAVSNEDLGKPHGKYFNQEIECMIQDDTETYLLSDNQVDYIRETIPTNNRRIYRSKGIVSKDYTKILSQTYTSSLDNVVKGKLDQVFSWLQIILYPMRIEDDRYCFPEVLEQDSGVVITNPTNIDVQQWLFDNALTEYRGKVVEIGTKDKRAEYFYALQKLKPTDKIYNFDEGVHLSTIEQLILTNAEIICPNIDKEVLNSYIA